MGPGLSMKVIDYVVGDEAGLEGRLLGALPIVHKTDADTMFRGEAMRLAAVLARITIPTVMSALAIRKPLVPATVPSSVNVRRPPIAPGSFSR
jgi:hypothetical protein